MDSINKQIFWDKKILQWEESKYRILSKFGGVFDINRSVKNRLQIMQKVLKKVSKNKSILEIGCGTGRLLSTVKESGALKYVGVDISGVAIAQAKIRAESLGINKMVEFYQLDACDLGKVSSDLCFSLGLLDWLEINEIQKMLNQINCQYYIHSFSRKSLSVQQLMHKLYVYFLYGYKTKMYIPQYYSRKMMFDMFYECNKVVPDFLKTPELSFGEFIHHLPRQLDNE